MEGLVEGRIVHYVLSANDAEEINRRRTNAKSISDRIALEKWPIGAQAHIGNTAQAGEHCPMLIVRVWNSNGTVNGQVFLDGSDTLWVTSVHHSEPSGITESRTWHWVEKA